MAELVAFRCVSCGRRYEPWSVDYLCPSCGPIVGTLEVVYDYRLLSRRLTPTSFAETRRGSLWRYEELLPVGREHGVVLRAGWTPLYPCRVLAAELGLSGLWIKDDSLNPTASYKDRATAVVVAAAKRLGREALTCASTGNTATSVAGFCAAAGIPAYIFVPQGAPEAKVAQLLAYGGTVFAVEGGYEAAQALCQLAREKFGWYDRSDGANPINAEGKKTGAFEIWEQLEGKLPDYVMVSVGDGSIIAGLSKGFWELTQVGLTDQMPKVYGVQAAGAPAVAQAFRRYQAGEQWLPAEAEAHTLADSIRVGKPQDVVKAVKYVARTGGGFVTVEDREMVAAAQALAREVGVFAEPAAAAAYAGLLKLLREEEIPTGAKVVVIITGSGLKDPQGVLQGLPEPTVIPPELSALENALSGA